MLSMCSQGYTHEHFDRQHTGTPERTPYTRRRSAHSVLFEQCSYWLQGVLIIGHHVKWGFLREELDRLVLHLTRCIGVRSSSRVKVTCIHMFLFYIHTFTNMCICLCIYTYIYTRILSQAHTSIATVEDYCYFSCPHPTSHNGR